MKQRHSEPKPPPSDFLFSPIWSTNTTSYSDVPAGYGTKWATPPHLDLKTQLSSACAESSNTSPMTALSTPEFFGAHLNPFPGLEKMDFDQFGSSQFDLPLDSNTNQSGKIDPVPSTESQSMDIGLGLDDPFSGFGNYVFDREDDTAETVTAAAKLSPVDKPSSCSGCCLLQAIALLKQLFTDLSTGCSRSPTPSSTEDNKNFVSSYSNLESIISKNKQTIETVTTILNCPCSQDAYLLAIMTLIVFKVINWYSTLARQSHTGHHPAGRRHSISGPLDDVGEEDEGRIAGQLILGELHGVQRLVSQLSRRLMADSVRSSMGQLLPDEIGSIQVADSDGWVPFSAAMLDQLEADLRKGLRTLFSEIVNMLRRV